MDAETPAVVSGSVAADGGAAPVHSAVRTAKGLAANGMGLLGAVTMGVGSAGPAYSLAASLGVMASVVGLKAPAMLIISFIPMLMVSTAFYSLARVDPDCGQAFAWVTRGLGPLMGWIVGFWGLAMVLVVAPNISNVVATYFYLLLGLRGAATSPFWLTAGSVVLLVFVTALVALGIELSVRVQYLLMGLQVGSLVVFAVATLVGPYLTNPTDHVRLAVGMFLPTHMSWSQMADGILIGIFFYTGWDVATSVAEESKDSHRLPAIGAVLSTGVLLLIFTFCAAGAQTWRGSQFLVHNVGDVLGVVPADMLGSPWDKIVVLAVFTATAAAALGMMVYVTRWTLSMASHRALASVFGRVSPRYMTPVWGTLILGGITIAARILMALVNENLVYDIVPSVALLSAIEYAFTAFACVVYFRHWLTTSLRAFVLMGLLPVLGGTILLAVYVKSAVNYWNPANSYSGGWLGVGVTFWLGVGATLLGAVLVLIARIHKPGFFNRKPETWPGKGRPIPYQDETVI